MEEDIPNYLPTVMFRGTPCMYIYIYTYKYVYSLLKTYLLDNLKM